MAANRSCQHVPVIWIRELQTWNQILVACYERIVSVLVHQCASAFQLFSRKIRALFKQTGNPFFVHVRGPLRTKEPDERQVHEQVPKLRGIEDVGVIERGEPGHLC